MFHTLYNMSYSHRIADLQLAERLEAFGAVLIEGPKWCGKTITTVSVSAMLVYTRQKNIAQVFILERYFFVSIYPAAILGTCLSVFLVAVLQLC